MHPVEDKFKLIIETGINPKDYFPNCKHILIYSFTIGDRKYFRFDDLINVPYQRAMQALVYFRELGMNCDADYIEAHTNAVDNQFKGSKLTMDNIVAMKQLNEQLKVRLKLPKEPDLMYKMAAVTFFDQRENPDEYEFGYGERKIAFWKKNLTLSAFFLQRPLLELIPYLRHAGEDLKGFSLMIQNASQEQYSFLSKLVSPELRTKLQNKLKLSPAV